MFELAMIILGFLSLLWMFGLLYYIVFKLLDKLLDESPSTRLDKWTDGKENEPKVGLRDIKVGYEVTFEGGRRAVVSEVGLERSDGTCFLSFTTKSGAVLRWPYDHKGDCTDYLGDHFDIISYRAPTGSLRQQSPARPANFYQRIKNNESQIFKRR